MNKQLEQYQQETVGEEGAEEAVVAVVAVGEADCHSEHPGQSENPGDEEDIEVE